MEREPGKRIDSDYDAVVLGDDTTATMLAAILARAGHRVLLIDAIDPAHARIGEVTIPFVSVLYELIADRYDVPEIGVLARHKEVCKHIGGSSGVKKSLGFTFHRPGHDPSAAEALQFNVPSEHGESHFYRPDVDAFLLRAAIAHGAEVVRGVKAAWIGVDVGEHRATVRAGHRTVTARVVVDASGVHSPVARSFGLRDATTSLTHRTRAMFAHMVGVADYDEVAPEAGNYGKPGRFAEGTHHHVFDGGWISVAPFDNHKRASQPVASVSVHLDPDAFVTTGSPDSDFAAIVARFPGIAAQFAGATTVTPWHAVAREQYSVSSAVGDRYCVVDAAAFGNDTLFARPLANSAEVVHGAAHTLLAALADDDLSAARLAYIDALGRGVAGYNDRVLRAAYVAAKSFPLWNAFARVWLLSSIIATLSVRRNHKKWSKTGEEQFLGELAADPGDGYWFPIFDGARELLSSTIAECDAVAAGLRSADVASQRVFDKLADGAFVPPIFDFADPQALYYQLSIWRQVKTLWWIIRSAPPEVKALAA